MFPPALVLRHGSGMMIFKSNSSGVVQFSTQQLNNQTMDGYQRREAPPSQKIYISNLSMDTDEPGLRKAFESYGTIVDVNVKSKDNGITFAFIEFDSVDSAEKAVDAMNKKQFLGKQLKVEFARGRNDRNDRGGFRDRGDRGDRGFRGGRGDYDRRPSGGDRPRGCFNCGEEGHFAKECPKPRQPRDMRDRNDRDGGFRGGSGRSYRDNDRYDRKKREDSNSKSKSRSRSGEKKRKSKKRGSSSESR